VRRHGHLSIAKADSGDFNPKILSLEDEYRMEQGSVRTRAKGFYEPG
jgi:hypothetical protein